MGEIRVEFRLRAMPGDAATSRLSRIPKYFGKKLTCFEESAGFLI